MTEESSVKELASFVDKKLDSDVVVEFVKGLEVSEGSTIFVYSKYGFTVGDACAYRIDTFFLAPEGLPQALEYIQGIAPGYQAGCHDRVYFQGNDGAELIKFDRTELLSRMSGAGLGDLEGAITYLQAGGEARERVSNSRTA